MAPSDQQTIEQLAARVEFLEDKIVDSLEIVKETQERMCADITKIKEAVYNPDTGLYARLRTLEEDRLVCIVFNSEDQDFLTEI